MTIKASDAIKLFAELSQDEKLHNNMPHTGCFIRADYICSKLEENGAKSAVIRAATMGNRMLQCKVACKDGEGFKHKDVNWSFHVAAAANVCDIDGQERLMVFDTALFDGPVSAESWSRVITRESYPLDERDLQLLPYRESGKKLLDKVFDEIGKESPEAFFASQPDKFADEEIVRRSSAWQKEYCRHMEEFFKRARAQAM